MLSRMRILELRAIRGPNYFSMSPVIYMRLDIGDLEQVPTDMAPGFRARIERMMPTLAEHECSIGKKGGFLTRVERGTWAGHVVEHVAIELQCLAKTHVGFGKTVSTRQSGVYDVVFGYRDEHVGIKAAASSVRIVEKLFGGDVPDVRPYVRELKRIRETSLYGPSTQAIVDEAMRRGIPQIRLNGESYVQLGHGRHQRRVQATVMDQTSALGVEIACDKLRTKEILSSMGVPVPDGMLACSLHEAINAAEKMGYPVVVKPCYGNHGRGVTTCIRDNGELESAVRIAQEVSNPVLVEKHIAGSDFRILVIGKKMRAAALREPASVIGDGIHTVKELIDETNRDPRRGFGHEKYLTKIEVDHMTRRLLSINGLTLRSIPRKDARVYLKSTANISTGGRAIDVTDDVHPLVKSMSERIARAIGLDVAGIDIIAPTLKEPLSKGISGVLEVNAAPGFRMHLNPSEGHSRNVASHVIDMLFPSGSKTHVPIVAVTGTNGKTTTVRLISHILQLNGNTVGMTSTDGVTIDNIMVLEGDYSGPEGAKCVLTDPAIDHAVLEVARGGILRRGLGFQKCDVGVFLNVSSDHLGEGYIHSLEELTRLKATVTGAVSASGHSVLNADDPLVLQTLEHAGGTPVLFSASPDNPALSENLEKGNFNVVCSDGAILLQRKGWTSMVARVQEIPATFGGRAMFNVENVLAAVAATSALGLDLIQIKAGLASFSPSIGQSPGRMNILDFNGTKVVIDYGHNVGALRATAPFLSRLAPGRMIRMVSGTGNRLDEDIVRFGEVLSSICDIAVVTDSDPRSRPAGESSRLVREGLVRGGLRKDAIYMEPDESRATELALGMARSGDLVVLQAGDVAAVIRDVLDYRCRAGDTNH